MTLRIVRRLLLSTGILLLPVTAYAQEATLTGTVTDSTGGVLPGVTVTALLEATGNTFVAVTDDRGIYRIPARVGSYQINAELQGFATVERDGHPAARGADLHVNLQMSPSTLQETVTVTGEAPLLSVATSSLGGNIDPQQVQEMPSEGRNWMALLLLAPGSRRRRRHGRAARDAQRGQDARVSDQRRRQAVRQHDGRRRPAGVQPGDDRGVPVHLEPLRCDAGPFVGRPGQHGHQVGHQPLRRIVPRATSATIGSTRQPGARSRHAD